MRKESSTNLKQNMFKLLTNSSFGRLLLNKEKYTRTLFCDPVKLGEKIVHHNFRKPMSSTISTIINNNMAESLQNSAILWQNLFRIHLLQVRPYWIMLK